MVSNSPYFNSQQSRIELYSMSPPPPPCIANSMCRILITSEIILITDIRQLISNSGVFKIQINMKSLYSSLYKLLSCEAPHSVNISFIYFF